MKLPEGWAQTSDGHGFILERGTKLKLEDLIYFVQHGYTYVWAIHPFHKDVDTIVRKADLSGTGYKHRYVPISDYIAKERANHV